MKRITITLATVIAMALPAAGCWWAYCEDDDDHITDTCDNGWWVDDDGYIWEGVGGQCVPWTCSDDSDCDAYSQCDPFVGQCQETECWDDWDCPGGTICDSGYGICVDEDICYDDIDCPLNSHCNLTTNLCEPDITPPTCTEMTDCTGSDICVDGNCVPGPSTCEDNADCGAGAYCEGGTCMPSGLCTDNNDCTNPMAPICDARGACVPDTAPECTDNNGCGEGERCVNGQCDAIPAPGPGEACQFDEQCEGGLCIDGFCQAPCTDISECGTGQDCVDNHCQDVETPGTDCVLNSECAGGQVCVNGNCLGGCVLDTDCPDANDRCDSGFCVADTTATPECTNNTQCTGVEECVNGVCRTPCAGDPDCAACGMPVCHLTHCFDAVPECGPALPPCGAGEQCADSQCVPE